MKVIVIKTVNTFNPIKVNFVIETEDELKIFKAIQDNANKGNIQLSRFTPISEDVVVNELLYQILEKL